MLELLEPPQRLAAEQQDRGPLRRESVLVNVGCKTRHAWHGEVEVRDGIAFHPREGGEEAAQAGVHVQQQPSRLGNRTELGNEIGRSAGRERVWLDVELS